MVLGALLLGYYLATENSSTPAAPAPASTQRMTHKCCSSDRLDTLAHQPTPRPVCMTFPPPPAKRGAIWLKPDSRRAGPFRHLDRRKSTFARPPSSDCAKTSPRQTSGGKSSTLRPGPNRSARMRPRHPAPHTPTTTHRSPKQSEPPPTSPPAEKFYVRPRQPKSAKIDAAAAAELANSLAAVHATERESSSPERPSSSAAHIEKAPVRLTHPDKLLDTESGPHQADARRLLLG